MKAKKETTSPACSKACGETNHLSWKVALESVPGSREQRRLRVKVRDFFKKNNKVLQKAHLTISFSGQVMEITVKTANEVDNNIKVKLGLLLVASGLLEDPPKRKPVAVKRVRGEKPQMRAPRQPIVYGMGDDPSMWRG